VITADGAQAGPNAITTVCIEADSTYAPTRGHCHVHLKRDVQKNKFDLFKVSCEDSNEVKEQAQKTTYRMELVKSHSITQAGALLGKQMIVSGLRDEGHEKAADYIEAMHDKKWTLVEMNVDTAGGGGVPCHQNSIERQNLEQKDRKDFKRAKVIPFLDHAVKDLAQCSMDDWKFGSDMPTGYTTSSKIDLTVWSVKFFDGVRREDTHPAGLQHLMWEGAWGEYKDALTVVMCSRKTRAWLMDDPEWGLFYNSKKTDAERRKAVRNALCKKTRMDGQDYPSYIKQFKDFVKQPAEYAAEQGWTFTEVMDWQQSFHILEPITDPVYLRSLLCRLRRSRLPLDEVACKALFPQVIPAEVDGEVDGEEPLECPPSKYIFKCSCRSYRHYAWCIHVMMRAVHDKLVSRPYMPSTMNSARVGSVRKGAEGAEVQCGRPANAKKGAALSH
jgi:hypothetical protein